MKSFLGRAVLSVAVVVLAWWVARELTRSVTELDGVAFSRYPVSPSTRSLVADPYRSNDILPAGTPVPDGYAGATFARDHDHRGFYLFGPMPTNNPLARLQGVTASQPNTLPPQLAQLALTRDSRLKAKLRSILLRSGKRLKPLVLGKNRRARA